MHELQDEWTKPSDAHAHVGDQLGKYWLGETVFFIRPAQSPLPGTAGSDEVLMTQWSPKQANQLAQHVRKLDEPASTMS
jgi:hypothetical protein